MQLEFQKIYKASAKGKILEEIITIDFLNWVKNSCRSKKLSVFILLKTIPKNIVVKPVYFSEKR